MHDIGKVRTPNEILNKPDKLTDEEFDDHEAPRRRRRGDPARARRRCRLSRRSSPSSTTCGSTAPATRRRHAAALNLGTMLCGIADVYDAMRSQREYQQAFPTERILAVLQRNDGEQFDQHLVRRFVQLLGIYPAGNLVKLNTGEVAVVLQVHAPDPYRPKVRVLFAADGAPLRAAARYQPLGDRAGRARRSRDIRDRSAQSRRLRDRSPVIHLIADILVRPTDERGSFGPLCPSQGVSMSGFHTIIPCAAMAALVFAGSSRITGQAPVENGRPIALAAAEDTLPAALERVDAMLTSGELNISQLQDDTLIPGRAIERLGQYYEGLPVFGGQVVRQMDGRAVVSVTGRLYESLDLDVNPSISPERASAVAVAAVGSGANVRGEPRSASCPSKADTASSIA